MKRASILVLGLLLAACEDERMTFGISVQACEPETPCSVCILPGQTESLGSLMTSDGPQRPRYEFEVESDADEQVYHVRVSAVTAYDEETKTATSLELLEERTYDSAFGETGDQDSFVVDVKGEQVTLTVLGIPASGGCPGADPADPSDAPTTSDL
ncbi:hypothetical protein WME76_14275 [Sorangium sp. So ce119]|uniref:hypothetical protein n=1 Tax=Sorangium sp. So ce119 TaxID=3133279 RepID=UPI003F606C4A